MSRERLKEYPKEKDKRPALRGRPASRRPEETSSRTVLACLKLLQDVVQMKEPATLSQIVKKTGLSPSRAHRYLQSLAQANFLRQDPETAKYDLGLAALEISMAAAARLDSIRIASDMMRLLTDKVGLASFLSVWGSNGPTVIRSEQGGLETAVRTREGTNLSLVATATGHVFLAYMDPSETEELLKRDLHTWKTSAASVQKISRKHVEENMRKIRAQGIAAVAGLRNPTLSALAAPIFGRDGRVSMCLTVIGVIGSFDASITGPVAQELMTTVLRLNHILGGIVPDGGSPELDIIRRPNR